MSMEQHTTYNKSITRWSPNRVLGSVVGPEDIRVEEVCSCPRYMLVLVLLWSLNRELL